MRNEARTLGAHAARTLRFSSECARLEPLKSTKIDPRGGIEAIFAHTRARSFLSVRDD
jgi:hypothetical protein